MASKRSALRTILRPRPIAANYGRRPFSISAPRQTDGVFRYDSDHIEGIIRHVNLKGITDFYS